MSHSLGAVHADTQNQLNQLYQDWKHLGPRAWEAPWQEISTQFTENIEKLLGAADNTVVPMQNATRAMAAVASCFEYPDHKNEIILSDQEFTTSYAFWKQQERLGADITVVTSDPPDPPTQQLIDAINSNTFLVATCHAYFQTGGVLDPEPIINTAHNNDAYVLLDGYQAAGTIPVDMEDLNVDFYVGGSHKWLCGGAGAGYLYVRPDLIAEMKPRLTGWFGLDNPLSFSVHQNAPEHLNPGVNRFLGGTSNIPGLYAAIQGITTVCDIRPERINERNRIFTEELITRAKEHNFSIHSPANFEKRNGTVCIQVNNPEAITKELGNRDIIVDYRPEAGIRVSFHFYNNQDDLEHFWEALTDIT